MEIDPKPDDCPYLENPQPECYCREPSNQSPILFRLVRLRMFGTN